MKVLIIDDELNAREGLKKMIVSNMPEIIICDVASSVLDGITKINLHSPDLIFLDINMPPNNGFELLDAFPNRKFQVVFTTAYNEYAIKAFRYAAADYLLKPINVEYLMETINRLKQQKSLNNTVIEQNTTDFTKLTISTIEGYEFVELSDILYLEASGNYTFIQLIDKRIYSSKLLKFYEDILSQNNSFYRVHLSYIVNKKHVSKYIKSDGGYLLMKNEKQIPISVKKKDEILNFIGL
jgi:two-component system LytT family response regulator